MDYLKRFAEEYDLEKIISLVAERPNVQGAILTLDDFWLTAWKYEESGRPEDLERLFWSWHQWGAGLYPFSVIFSPPWIPQRPPDLSWRPPHWRKYCHIAGRDEDMLPVRLIVCLRPPTSGEDVGVPDLPRSRLPVSFEVRPIARLATNHRRKVRPVVGGISVGTGPRVYGTLGGIVKDKTGLRYGMTCAHVFPSATSVEQPAPYDDAQATTIGTSTTSIVLQHCPGTGQCNPYTQSQHITSIDTTLVEFNTDIAADLEILSIGPLTGVVAKNSMSPGQEITFVGRTSGNRIAEVGGLGIFYRLKMNGQTYCFRDLFEIRWRSFIRTFFGPVVQAGDSGAWVCAETDQGPAWCGQIIGEDRRVGYAAFAENTIAAWSDEGKHLSVV